MSVCGEGMMFNSSPLSLKKFWKKNNSNYHLVTKEQKYAPLLYESSIV